MNTIYFMDTMSTLFDEGYITDTRSDYSSYDYLYTEHEMDDESYLEDHSYPISNSDTLIALHVEHKITQHDYG